MWIVTLPRAGGGRETKTFEKDLARHSVNKVSYHILRDK
jgi:hypothetical protein